MTAQVRARELLFPVLLLPVQVPVLLATVSATQALAARPAARRRGRTGSSCWPAPISSTSSIGLLTFEFVLEG